MGAYFGFLWAVCEEVFDPGTDGTGEAKVQQSDNQDIWNDCTEH